MITSCTGFLHPMYAASFAELGVPHKLKRSGAWIIQRVIPGSSKLDAMGIYPMVLCEDWAGLAPDLDKMRADLVCVGLVTDPFGHYDEPYLRRCFPDLVVAFKEHHITDLRRPREESVSTHHRRKARRANLAVNVEICPDPMVYAQDWIELYGMLVRRHFMRGVSVFSPSALLAQLAVPGVVMLRAVREGKTVGVASWYVTQNVAYGHLAAYSQSGYAVSASYAIFWRGHRVLCRIRASTTCTWALPQA